MFTYVRFIYLSCSGDEDDIPIETGATIRMSPARTLFGIKPAPVMASFSSRGPNKIQPSILKVHIHVNYYWISYTEILGIYSFKVLIYFIRNS